MSIDAERIAKNAEPDQTAVGQSDQVLHFLVRPICSSTENF